MKLETKWNEQAKQSLNFFTIISKMIVDFVSLKREWALHDKPQQINQSYTEFISTHLKRGYPAGKEFLGTLVKTAAKYKTVLVDNQLTLFTTAKTSSN